jgi:hypothetical protein
MDLETIYKRLGGVITIMKDLNLHQFTVERWRVQGIPQKHWDYVTRKLKDVTVSDIYNINKKIKSR